MSAPINKSFQGGGRGGGWGRGAPSRPALRPGAVCCGCGDAVAAAAAPKWTSRAVSPGKSAAAVSRAPGQPSARGAELAAASPVAAHYSSVSGEAAAPGLRQVPDWIAHRGLSSCNPAYFGWLLLRPKGELWCLCVNASERDRGREPTPCGGGWRFGPTDQQSFLPPRFLAPPMRSGQGSRRGRLRRSPALASPTLASALAWRWWGGGNPGLYC